MVVIIPEVQVQAQEEVILIKVGPLLSILVVNLPFSHLKITIILP